jgi:hypothetical protein
MIAGVSGRLLTTSYVRMRLSAAPGAGAAVPPHVLRALRALSERIDIALGPASGIRAITDVAVMPLLRLLGFTVSSRHEAAGEDWLLATGGPVVGVFEWNAPLDRAWRSVVLRAIAADVRWCFCCNGRALRIVDARQTWSRDHLEIDLRALSAADEAAALLWSVARADAMTAAPPVLDIAVAESARHGVEVCRALGDGVLHALGLLLAALSSRQAGHPLQATLEHSLTVVYRVLFLLFAEARGLVPMWHPVYRDRYSIDSIVTALAGGRPCRGLWHAVQAISRMAYAGCSAGELRVTAFNGRLFSPSQAAAFERMPLDDRVMREAILAVSTVPPGTGRRIPAPARTSRARIAYRDLDVEQLGAVYERVLDYEPASSSRSPALIRTRDLRRASGSFYTPRAVTSFLVRRTLAPLIANRTAAQLLELRILDPAMGSGAFLVAACRYLAAALEDALIDEGRWHPAEISPGDRASLRREIASRCLYGVDLNPTAVQLARLSLWLATLAADRPLSFLDHHLVAGDSLVGAAPADLARQPARGRDRRRRGEALPLFDDDLTSGLDNAVRVRLRLALEPDDSAATVRDKERALSALHARGTALERWSRALDLWCAGWFWDGPRLDRATINDLVDNLLGQPSALPRSTAAPLLDASRSIGERCRFLHWPIAFPEVFDGAARGFDAVVVNPPWDMVRGDSGDDHVREERRRRARQTIDFVREAGIYHVDAQAHVNRYQLFVERALQLARPGGRIGLVLPGGIVGDAGAAPLRRHLFEHAAVDSITGLDNRAAFFPIHRSLRFVLLTATCGARTQETACRFGIQDPADLDAEVKSRAPLVLTRSLLSRLSGEDDLAIPELANEDDLRVVERISSRIPRLGDRDGWQVQFGRELNASDDRAAFTARSPRSMCRPVVEGKQLDPFRVSIDRCTLQLAAGAPQATRVPRRARLAYRDIASATNRVTLIAAIVPARAVTTHTLFCLRTPLPLAEQAVLCALLNSFVANYLVRLRVNTHVTVALVSRLWVPAIRPQHPEFARLATLAQALLDSSTPVEEMPEYVRVQAIVARLYGLTTNDFEHVLETFPLVPRAVRDESLRLFNDLR